jgi:Right handed beta helix region
MIFPLLRKFRSLILSTASDGARHRLGSTGVTLEPLEDRTLMSTYYISTSGKDGNNGLSPQQAWLSIAKVNAVRFKPGDKIEFQGGKTFAGSLMFRSYDGNSMTNPVIVTSYGSGYASIFSGKSNGAYVYDTSGIWFENLNFTGTPNGINHNGIRYEAASGGKGNILVDHCNICGYGSAGILVGGDGGNGFTNIRLTFNNCYYNVDAGIMFYSGVRNIHRNVYIGHNNVFDNYGDGTSAVTGSGMMLGGLNNATVEYNNAYSNGNKGGNGGCGIWTYDSTNVVFQYNVSYGNRSLRGHDGDGFDFDLDTQNSVMQFNYAYDNDGNGFQLNQWQNNTLFTNNVVRYNVSQNNSQRNNYAGLEVWGRVISCTFYSNLVYVQPTAGEPSGIKVHNSTIGNLFVSNLGFYNNVIVVAGGRPAVTVPGGELFGAKGLSFRANLYWGLGNPV